MSKHSLIVTIKDREIQNKKAVKAFFVSLPDGKYILEADNSKKRTNQQNRYLHGILIPEFRKALNSVGYDGVKYDWQAKLIIKKMFLTRQVVNEETGEVLEYVQDTHDLTTVELNVLIEEVIRFAAENMNYEIMLPNQQSSFVLAEWDNEVKSTIIQ